MGIFGQNSSQDADVEKATNEKNTIEDWTLIIEVCDKITSSPRNTKDYVKAILRRMGHNDPHVVIQALTLLDACINNCGKSFHLEVASRDFETEYRKLLAKVESTVATKMKLKLKRWSENEFKSDPQLNLIPSFYQKLKAEGHDFTDYSQKTAKSAVSAAVSKDPNVVTSQQEEDDLAKAIELSLKESAKPSPNKQVTTTTSSSTYPSLYPSFTNSASASPLATSTLTSAAAAGGTKELRKVRALYDFEAAEDNEMTFKTGEFIHVIDDADPNWWKGVNQRGEGLFPSNFVTADLSDHDNFEDKADEKQKASKEEEQADKNFVPEVNEEKIDRLLHLLHEANPEDPSQDPPEMLRLENEVHQMGPLIDSELERVDRKHAQLTMLSSNLVEAINLYHTLMRDDRMMGMGGFGSPYGRPPPQQQQQPPPQVFAQPGGFSMYQMNPGAGMYQGPQNMQLPGQFMPPQQQPPVPINYQNGHQSQQMIHQQPPPQQQSQQQPQPPQVYNLPPQQPTQFPGHLQLNAPPHQNGMPQGNVAPLQQPPAPPMMENGMNQPHFNPMMMMGPPGPPHPSQQQQLPNSFQPYPHLGNPGMAAAAAAIGINSINQPVTQSFLGQNDTKNNIPVYQQQR